MESTIIFQITDPREILVHAYQEKKERNPQFSIRAWAKKLGFRNPSYLSEVLNGKRNLTPDFALRIAPSLDLTEDQRRYFETLTYSVNAKDAGERAFFEALLTKLRPKVESRAIGLERSSRLRDLTHVTLDEMAALSDFREEANYLARRLGPDITPQMVEIAIKDLLEIGTMYRDTKGRLRHTQEDLTLGPSPTDLNEVAQHRKTAIEFKRKIWERAAKAYLEQPVDQTEFASFILPIKQADFHKIVEMVRYFAGKEFARFRASDGTADEVYCLDTRLFKLTLGAPRTNGKEGKS